MHVDIDDAEEGWRAPNRAATPAQMFSLPWTCRPSVPDAGGQVKPERRAAVTRRADLAIAIHPWIASSLRSSQ